MQCLMMSFEVTGRSSEALARRTVKSGIFTVFTEGIVGYSGSES